QKRLPSKKLLLWLITYTNPYRASFLLFIAVSIFEILIGLLAPWTIKILIDNVWGSEPLPSWLAPIIDTFSLGNKLTLLLAVCFSGLVIGLANQLISLSHTQLQVGIGQKLVLDLQRDLFEHLQKLSLRYHQHKGTGDAIYRMSSDSYCISNIVMQGLFPLASSVLTLGLMFIILLNLEWTLALLSLIVLPPLFLVIDRYSARLSERSEKIKEMESNIYNLVHEVFSSIKLVKAFSREHYEREKFEGQNSETFAARLKMTFQESFFSVLVSSLMLIGTTAVLAVGGWHVLRGSLTVGELIVVLAYLGSVYAPLSAISQTIGSLQDSMTSARRVYQTLHLKPEIEDAPGAVEVANLNGHIKFENVSFAYDKARSVLKKISFEIEPGQMAAIVGLTGAGKTTLVSLIPRFYDATGGRISIDGADVREMQLKSLRESISIVTQEPILFSSSVGENIRYGRLNASAKEIAEAAKAAQAHKFIEQMPEGYKTLLGEAGSQLSGGERQRVSIARALLKDAPILILDEPTSALDSRSENLVFTALRRLMKNRTTIVIAHRLSTIRDADKIIVIDDGQLVGEGTHEELMKENGLYRELYERLVMGFDLETNEAPTNSRLSATAETG
ncbi:MAG: ABC transporter ATP-binding protein, partial [Pyrinomonadaceae bacterium]